MKRLTLAAMMVAPIVALATALGSACSVNECERASERANVCGYNKPPDTTTTTSSTGPEAAKLRDCNTVAECQATCFNRALDQSAYDCGDGASLGCQCAVVSASPPDEDAGPVAAAYASGRAMYLDCLQQCR